MRYLLIVFLLASCTSQSGVDNKQPKFEEVCIDGVAYILFIEKSRVNPYKGFSFMSVKFN